MNRGDIMKKHRLRILVIILIILFLPGLVSGCSGGKEAEKKPSSSSEKAADLPPALKSIRSELEGLIAQLEQTVQILSGKSTQDEQQSGEEGGEQQNGGQGQQESSSASGQKESPSSKIQDTWSKINDSVKKVHQNWNDAEAAVVKEGLSTDIRDKFEKALEELTIKTDERNIEESVFAAIEVYRYYPDMVELFDSKIPAEFFRLRYEVMLIKAESGRGNWEQARAELPNLKAQWNILKKNEAIKNEDISKKTENSLNDLGDAVEKQEACLVEIKSEIVMKNMDALEKKLNTSM